MRDFFFFFYSSSFSASPSSFFMRKLDKVVWIGGGRHWVAKEVEGTEGREKVRSGENEMSER